MDEVTGSQASGERYRIVPNLERWIAEFGLGQEWMIAKAQK
jgi:hypothetical protein